MRVNLAVLSQQQRPERVDLWVKSWVKKGANRGMFMKILSANRRQLGMQINSSNTVYK